jgi:hypothetical protein
MDQRPKNTHMYISHECKCEIVGGISKSGGERWEMNITKAHSMDEDRIMKPTKNC